MKEELFTIDRNKTETFNMVHRGFEVVIFEDGWWMKRNDYDELVSIDLDKSKDKWGIDRNKETRQLTLYLIPQL